MALSLKQCVIIESILGGLKKLAVESIQ